MKLENIDLNIDLFFSHYYINISLAYYDFNFLKDKVIEFICYYIIKTNKSICLLRNLYFFNIQGTFIDDLDINNEQDKIKVINF